MVLGHPPGRSPYSTAGEASVAALDLLAIEDGSLPLVMVPLPVGVDDCLHGLHAQLAESSLLVIDTPLCCRMGASSGDCSSYAERALAASSACWNAHCASCCRSPCSPCPVSVNSYSTSGLPRNVIVSSVGFRDLGPCVCDRRRTEACDSRQRRTAGGVNVARCSSVKFRCSPSAAREASNQVSSAARHRELDSWSRRSPSAIATWDSRVLAPRRPVPVGYFVQVATSGHVAASSRFGAHSTSASTS